MDFVVSIFTPYGFYCSNFLNVPKFWSVYLRIYAFLKLEKVILLIIIVKEIYGCLPTPNFADSFVYFQLVGPIKPLIAIFTFEKFHTQVPPLMVFSVSVCNEFLATESTSEGLLPCVSPHVLKKGAFVLERLLTPVENADDLILGYFLRIFWIQ